MKMKKYAVTVTVRIKAEDEVTAARILKDIVESGSAMHGTKFAQVKLYDDPIVEDLTD